MTVNELIERVRDARADWDALIEGIDEARMTEPGVTGDWSLKDMIAHISWFEKEMIGVVRERALVGSELWLLPPHERNAAIHAENRDRPLAEVRADAKRTFAELMEVLPTLADEDLTDATRFADMPPDWVPGEIIAQNTWEHYEAHRRGVEAWLS
jgi:hypothetical protein